MYMESKNINKNMEGKKMIKFNKYNVTNTETKEKARVWYSLNNRVDGRKA